MKKILCISLLFFISSGLLAQAKDEAEQVREKLKTNPKEDTARVHKLILLSWLSTEVEEKERTAREALALSEKIDYDKGRWNALLYLVNALMMQDKIPEVNGLLDTMDSIGKATSNYGLRAEVAFKRTNIRLTPDPKDALKYMLDAISFAQRGNIPRLLSHYQQSAGVLYMGTFGNYPKALEFFLAAEKTAEVSKVPVNLIWAWLRLGNLYNAIGEEDKALGYMEKAFKTNSDSVDQELNFSLQNILGESYRLKGRYSEALAAHKKSLNNAFDPFLTAIAESNIANIYLTQDSLALAFQYAFSALKNITTDDIASTAGIYYFLSKAYLKKKMADSALYYAQKGLTMAKETASLETIRDNAESLAEVYLLKNDYRNAYTFRNLFITYRDSVLGTEVKNKTAVLGYNNELEKKETRITTLSRQQKLQKNFLISVSAALLLIIITAIVLLRNNRQKRLALAELKQTQNQLIHSEKMASLGELTAGIAHEIQNPLNFVNNFSEVNTELIGELVDEVNKDNKEDVKAIAQDIKQNLEKITHHGKRADAIVKGMLQHSRKSTGEKEPADINALADEYLKLTYHGMRAKDKAFNVTMNTDFDSSIGKIKLISQDIGSVLLNLYNNAFYATNEKKKNTGENYTPAIWVSTKKINNKVEIKVKDNGSGIPEHIINKIFQPFFITKPTGEGTGLGLSLAYDIVKANGGEIKIEPEQGVKTSFIIFLPA